MPKGYPGTCTADFNDNGPPIECKKCGELKDRGEYYCHKSRGWWTTCKRCFASYQSQRSKLFRSRHNEKLRRWRAARKEHCNRWQREYRKTVKGRQVLSDNHKRLVAKRKTNGICPYCTVEREAGYSTCSRHRVYFRLWAREKRRASGSRLENKHIAGLISKHGRLVERIVSKKCMEQGLAAEAVVDVWVRCLSNYRKDPNWLSAFKYSAVALTMLAKSCAVDALRRELGREGQKNVPMISIDEGFAGGENGERQLSYSDILADHGPLPDSGVESNQMMSAIQDAINAIPRARDKDIYRIVRVQEQPYSTAAKKYDLSESGVLLIVKRCDEIVRRNLMRSGISASGVTA